MNTVEVRYDEVKSGDTLFIKLDKKPEQYKVKAANRYSKNGVYEITFELTEAQQNNFQYTAVCGWGDRLLNKIT